MEEVKVKIGIDDKGFATGLQRDIRQMEQLSATAKKGGMSIDDMGRHVKQLGRDIDAAADKGVAGFSRLEKAAIGFFTIQKAKEFIGKVYEVRSEIEKLETSFRILVGNKEEADVLFASIRKFAVETPMQLKDLAGAAQTMMGFGIAAGDVMEDLKALGNVAMGDSQKFQSLALAFSQMSATGKLMGQDFLQMVNAGFNPLDQMAKTTGKSVAMLKKEMSEGAISADMVRQAFIDATGEGGKFNGMLEAQSKTMAGAYSNLQGAIDDMLNEIGQKSEGIMSGAIDVATTLAQNYETVGKVLMGLIGTYGVYKAAVMVVNALETFRIRNLTLQAVGISGVTAAEAVHYGWLVLVQKAQALLNATMLANPYVAIATAVAALVAVMVTMKSQQDLVNEAQEEYNRKKEETIAKEKEHADKLNELISIAGNESLSTDTRREAMLKLKKEYPDLFEKYKTEIEALKDIAYWKAKIAEIESGKSITLAKNELEDVNRQIAELESRAKANYEAYMRLSPQEKRYASPSLTREEAAKLTQLRNTRETLTKEQKKASDAAYLKNLTGVSNEELQRQISERRNLIARIEMQEREGKKNIKGRVVQGGVTGLYDKAELRDQLQTMEWEQNRRAQIIADGSKDFVAEAKKAYNEQKLALQQLEALHDPLKRASSSLEIDGKKVSEMGSDEFLAAIEKQQKAVDEAKKKVDAYNKARNGGSASTSKQDSAAKEDAARRERVFEQELSDRERQAQQLEAMKDAQANAAIANELSRAKRELMQLEKDHRDRLDAIDRQSEAMKKANYEAQKKAWEAANTDKTKSWSDTDTAKDVAANGFANIKLTQEQMATLKALRDKENADYARSVKERFEAERQSMLDYLQEYGTYQQQRLAIAEEYSKKIAEASGNKWEAKRLTAERDSRIAQANAQSLAMNIDWNQTFQGIGNVLQDIAKETLQRVNDYMGTAEFKGLDAAAKKAYTDLKQQLIDAGGQTASNPFSSSTWDEIAKLTDEYKFHVKALADASGTHESAVTDYQNAVESEKEARAALDKAIREQAAHLGKTDQGDYDDAVNRARENLAQATQGVADSFKKVEESGEAVNQQQQNVNTTQQNLHTKTEAAAQGLNNFNTVLGQITSGSLKGFVDGVSNVIAALTKNTKDDMEGLIGLIGKKAGGIIGAILSIIDMLGDKPVEFFDSLFDGISKVIEAVISHIPEIIWSVVKGVGNIVGSIGTGIAGLFGAGGQDNHEEQLKKQQEYTSEIESTTHALEKMSEVLEKSYGIAAKEAAEREKALLGKNQESMVKGLDAALWDNYGGGHSDYWHWNKNTADIARQIAERYGLNAWDAPEGKYTWNALFGTNDAKAVAEALRQVRDSESEWWRILTTQGYNGGEVKDWLNQLAESAEQYEEIEERLNEQLTGTTAENVFSGVMDALYDFANGSEDAMDDIAANWQQMVNKMVVNGVVGQKMMEDLEEWYEKFSAIDPNNKDAIEALREEYDKIVDWGVSEVERLQALGLVLPTDELTDEARKYFDGLLDSWKSTLTDMSQSAEDWKSQLLDEVFADLVESTILDVPVTLTTTETEKGEQAFDDFEAYLKDWTRRYKAVIEDATLTDEERNARLKALIAEQEALREELAGRSREIAEGIGKDIIETFSNALDGLGDTLLDTLLDAEKSVGQMGAEIGQTLVREMLKEMLAQDKYKHRIDTIRSMWQAILKGEDTEHSLDDVIADITALSNDMAADTEIQKATAAFNDFGEVLKSATSSFGDLHDTFMDAVFDMENGAASLSKKLREALAKDLVEKNVFGKAFELNGKQFANFDEYQKDWTKRYLQALEAGDEALMAELVKELEEREDAMAKSAEETVKAIREAVKDTTFIDMADSLVSSLMDVEGDVEDIANDMKKTIVKKLVEAFMVSDQIKPLLDELQATFNAVMGMEGLTPEQRAQMMKAGFTGTDAEGNEKVFLGIDDEGVTQRLTAAQTAIKTLMEAIGYEFDKKEGFSDLRGAFISALTDMEGDASTFGKNIGKTMAEQMLDAYIDKTYSEEIDKINEEWADALASGDPTKIEAVRQKVLDLYAAIGNDESVKNLTADVKKLDQELDSTFKDMGDSWVSALIDMDSTASDFGRQIGQTLVSKLVKELIVTKQLQTFLNDIQKAYDEAIAKDGATIESVLAAVTPAINAAVTETEKWKPVIEEVAKRFQELDNSTPLDNIRSTFLSQLMDMESDTKDFAKSISEILTEAFIDKFVLGEEFDNRLEEWKQEYASIMRGNYSEEDRATLLKQLKQAITTAKEGYAAEAAAIHDLMGTANYADQQATMNMSDKATYEQMDQYLGVQMGIYMVTEQILTTLRGGATIDIPAVTLSSFSMATETTAKQILSAIQTMKAATSPDSSTILEMRNMMATGNEYLLDIKRSNREILTQFGAVLNSINGKLAKL